jgi:hypothetical protein
MEKIIDLNLVYKENLFKHLKNNSGILSGGEYLKHEKIIKTIKENIEGYEIIIIPISILNIIEKSNCYLPCDKIIEANLTKKNFYYYVGSFLHKEVFIDLSLLDNIAILSYSKQTKREMRLDSIINSNPIKEDLRLKFIY